MLYTTECASLGTGGQGKCLGWISHSCMSHDSRSKCATTAGWAMQNPAYQWVDIGIIVAYMASMMGIGAYFTRRQKSASEYLLASRQIGWFAIGLSLLATLNSAVDYVIGPAQILEIGRAHV
jgi:hypothetical protein